jgi:predicted nucleotide-binding protein (sugar kinase/HSP70/actin superfamily)
MQPRIGLPQAMLYHEYGGLWTDFFRNMKIPIAVSGNTNKQILSRGTALAIDESCLPLKVYLGHVDALLSHQCTHIFIPRISQCHRNFYFCAKFAGLPDIVINTFRLSSNQIISPNIENSSPITHLRAIYDSCRTLGLFSAPKAFFAYKQALKNWKNTSAVTDHSFRKIAVIGHSYLVKDEFFNHTIMKVLTENQFTAVTPDNVANKVLYNESKAIAPDIYWQLSAKIAGAAQYYCRQNNIVGILLLSSFGCGPDSLVNEYIEHHILKRSKKPYIILNIDEHTGSAGLITRIEAFLDLVDWRTKL